MSTTDITATQVRQSLLTRCAAFSEAHKVSFSRIGDEAVKDSKFLSRVQAGDNFTLKTYQRVIDWLDAQEAARGATPAPQPEGEAA